jgi:tartrate-resistant acid phosphatase type 5
MRWPFQAWGADVVCSGHEHIYERLSVDGIPYFISGTGGSPRYGIGSPLPESRARDASDFGALFVSVHAQSLTFDYVTVSGKHVDSFALEKSCPP